METSLKILLLEDEDDGVEMIRKTLSEAGIDSHIIPEKNQESGLEILKSQHFDCILVDYELPLGGGLKFIKEARDMGILIPIIVVNLEEQQQIIMDIMKAGASDYLIHGLMTSESLTHIIRRSLEMQRVTAEMEQHKSSLQESEDRFHEIIENAPYAIITFDKDNKIIDWNPRAEDIFGFNMEEIKGESLLERIIPAKYRKQHREEFEYYISSGDDTIMNRILEVTACNKAGHEFPIELKFTVVKVNDETFFIAFVRDLTKSKAQEKALETKTKELVRSNRELENFAYVASHDLKEPLRMITSYSKLLQRDKKSQLTDSAREFLGYITEGAERMKTLIEALLEYSRIGMDNNYRRVDLNLILNEVLQNLNEAIKEKDAKVIIKQLPSIQADPVQMSRLFQNLLMNALKFNEQEKPRVEVRCEYFKADREWRFSIHDNGIGIPENAFQRIFMPFQRLHSRTEYDGTGIGLAACKKIVENHGGKIWVESEEGRGSSFFFTIPQKTEKNFKAVALALHNQHWI